MSRRPLNILLVEDNPDHAELLRRHLENFSMPNVLNVVEDGDTALAYVLGQNRYADRARFPAPDLMLLDLRLPRLDGMEVLRRIKSHADNRRLPIVVLTTSDAERDVAMAYERQADCFLVKPVDAERLHQVLQELGLDKP